jgi:hypothetical protein
MGRSPKAPPSRPPSHFTGQVLGNTVEIKSNVTLNHLPVFVPGLDNVQGSNQIVVSIREVIS